MAPVDKSRKSGGPPDVYELLAPAYEILASPARIQAEVDALEPSLRSIGAMRILDAGCAVGLHSSELARRGFWVTGIDRSPSMIKEAKSRAAGLEKAIRPRFRLIEIEACASSSAVAFDAIVCMGNTINYAHTGGQRRRVLKAFRAALRPGGLLVLQLRDLTAVRKKGFIFPVRNLRREGREWILLRRQDPAGGRVRFVSTLLFRPDADAPWEMRVSESLTDVVGPAPWREALERAGFRRIRIASDLAGKKRRPGAPDLVIFARAD